MRRQFVVLAPLLVLAVACGSSTVSGVLTVRTAAVTPQENDQARQTLSARFTTYYGRSVTPTVEQGALVFTFRGKAPDAQEAMYLATPRGELRIWPAAEPAATW